ncbi:lectin [Amylocystis lapponica]|nr:lectin [Amylocystis lapponica]
MSYTITARKVDVSTIGFFFVEKTVWYFAGGGTWSDTNGIQTLAMPGSGTSGGIRVVSSDGTEAFYVAVGIHNYKRWCDVVTDITDSDTSMKLHPQYYESGERAAIREKQLAEIERTSKKGTKIAVKYLSQQDNAFLVDIVVS